MRHPRRNEVFRDVGSEEHTPDDADFIEVQRVPFEPDGALLLCSDGLSDQVPSARDSARRWSGTRAIPRRGARTDRGGQRGRRQGQRDGGGGGGRAVHRAGRCRWQRRGARGALDRRRCCSLLGLVGGARRRGWFTRARWAPPPVVIVPRVITVTDDALRRRIGRGACRRYRGSAAGRVSRAGAAEGWSRRCARDRRASHAPRGAGRAPVRR